MATLMVLRKGSATFSVKNLDMRNVLVRREDTGEVRGVTGGKNWKMAFTSKTRVDDGGCGGFHC